MTQPSNVERKMVDDRVAAHTHSPAKGPEARTWIERVSLANFRNYASLSLQVGPEPVVLCGANGAGKTNLLEALSLLTAGQGLRRAPYPELARMGSPTWAVAARLRTHLGTVEIGTGLADRQTSNGPAGRVVRIDGETQTGSGVLASYAEMVWLTPAMDGLFTGPASDRRRFLDRLIQCFDPGYRAQLGQFERAMQQRNCLLADDVRDAARFEGLERIMAERGIAITASRSAAVAEMRAAIEVRRERSARDVFPWAEIAVAGALESALQSQPAVDVEDSYFAMLQTQRERDRAAGRTLEGPHRSDLIVGHGPKDMPAKLCSTGEQKALLVGLVLAHAELVRRRRSSTAPILLLDEIAAHLDPLRRSALFEEITALGSQAWLSGTDREAFAALANRAQFHRVEDGRILPLQ